MKHSILPPLLALLVGMPILAARGERGDAPIVNGLRWTIQTEAHVSDREELPAHIGLLAPAAPEEAKWTFLRQGGADPYLELRDSSGAVRRHAFDVIPANESRARTVNRYSQAVDAHVKLSDAFGALSPGTYTLRAVLPSDAYGLATAPAYTPADVASAEVTFTVERVTVDEAAAASEPTTDVVVRIDPPTGDDHAPEATITNKTSSAISITAYVEGRKPAALRNVSLGVPVMPEVYRGSRGWVATPGGWCGTGLGVVTIAPGASQRLQLYARGAGVIRYRVPYQVAGAARNAPARTAVSNVIDSGVRAISTPTTAPAAR